MFLCLLLFWLPWRQEEEVGEKGGVATWKDEKMERVLSAVMGKVGKRM